MKKALAALCLLALAVYPVGSFLADGATALAVKLVFAAALALGLAWPVLGACALVAVVPLLPILPFTFAFIPHGVVHLAVLSQAIPLLVRAATGRERMSPDPVGWSLVVLVATGAASVASFYYAFHLVFPSFVAFARELHTHLSQYVFLPPSKEVANRIVALSVFCDALLAYLIVRSAAQRAGAAIFLQAAGAGAILVSVAGLLQAWTGAGLRPMWRLYDPGIIRINATYSDPNALAAYLALTMPLLCALIATSSGWKRWTWAAMIPAPIVVLVMTAGRMGVVATVAGLALLAWTIVRHADLSDDARLRLRAAMKWSAAALAAVSLVLTMAGTTLDVRHRDQRTYLHTLLYTSNLRAPVDETLKGRLRIWRTSLLMVRENPTSGVGLGAIYRKFADYNDRAGGGLEQQSLSAHNTFLNITAELGVTGLFAWLAVLGCLCRASLARQTDRFRPPEGVQHRSSADEPWVRFGLTAGLAGYCLSMATGDRTILREDVVLFFAMSALLPVCAYEAASRCRWAPRAAAIAVLVLVVTWPVRALREASAIDLTRISWGFYDMEHDGEANPFRWTGARAVFHVPADAGSLTLPVRSLAPFAQTVTVMLDEHPGDELVLDDHDWHTHRYALPVRRGSSRYHRVELRVVPTWRPPTDPRELGAVVGPYRWTAAPRAALAQ